MQSFRKFLHRSEEEEDLNGMLEKIPQSHRDLVADYKFKLQGGNTLKDDGDHIGYMDSGTEEIAVAAPWNYGREFALLHEVAHVVWENLVSDELRQKWQKIVNRTKEKQNQKLNVRSSSLNQSAEEIFCMCYANYYANQKLETYTNSKWMHFIKNLPH